MSGGRLSGRVRESRIVEDRSRAVDLAVRMVWDVILPAVIFLCVHVTWCAGSLGTVSHTRLASRSQKVRVF
jgi:hypothetical protein